jgi:ubiquinone/menaquinone biosynthesis C-methylase UbiE
MDLVDFNYQDNKYSQLSNIDYRESKYKKLMRILFKENSPENISVIDLGFGNGDSLLDFKKKGYNVTGVEISTILVKKSSDFFDTYHTSLDNLSMFDNSQFNLGFCSNVLEHIEEKYLHKTLEEMIRVCDSKIYLSVSPYKSHQRSVFDKELHLTVKSKEEWESFLSEYGKIERIKPLWHLIFFKSPLRYKLEVKK